MKTTAWIGTALTLLVLPGISQARDTTHYLPFDAVVAEATQAGRLDGSVKFYLAGKTPGNATVVRSGVTTVIHPFLVLTRSRGQAARANFCLGVMPPRAIFGRS